MYASQVLFSKSFYANRTLKHSLQKSLKNCNRTRLQVSPSVADLFTMTPAQIDFYFPFVVFFYGFLAVLVLETPALARLGRERMAAAWQGLEQRRSLAWISFFLGGVWSLQNLWF